MDFFSKLLSQLERKQKLQIVLLLSFTIIVSCLEVFNLAILLPYIAFILEPEKILLSKYFFLIKNILGQLDINKIIIILSLILILTVIFSALLRILLNRFTIYISFEITSYLSKKIFRQNLHKGLEDHQNVNSSEIISKISLKTQNCTTAIMSSISFITNFIIGTFILISLFIINFYLTAFAIIIFSFFYYIVYKVHQSKIKLNSKIINHNQELQIKLLQEALLGIREVILRDLYDLFIKKFNITIDKIKTSYFQNSFLSQHPKYIAEALVLIFFFTIVIFAFYFQTNIKTIIPTLTVFAIASQKLLPIFNQSYLNLANILSNRAQFNDVIQNLEQTNTQDIKKNNDEKIFFDKSIRIKNVWFRYGNSNKWIIKNTNVVFNKNKIYGINGLSGSGKTTFMDLILGLRFPTKGEILIDDQELTKTNIKSWHKIVSHVPQKNIFFDSTITENITFKENLKKIEKNLLYKSVKMSEIFKHIEKLPKKFKTRIGEGGVRLSGGQLQRLVLARTFFANAEVLFLDEATNALDQKTEFLILNTLLKLKKNRIIFIITHNKEILKLCDRVYNLKNGYLKND